ncbi:MAG TPA: hypothetical protein VEJ00_12595 [Candidatus Acidoferrales bacterium]|nr:hypothetical protein [Candidatus Acidoferrales bacterium]
MLWWPDRQSDRADLRRLLDAIRGACGKVIMTSRSIEDWLKPSQRFQVLLGGLDGEERQEYCEVILRELVLRVNRERLSTESLRT